MAFGKGRQFLIKSLLIRLIRMLNIIINAWICKEYIMHTVLCASQCIVSSLLSLVAVQWNKHQSPRKPWRNSSRWNDLATLLSAMFFCLASCCLTCFSSHSEVFWKRDLTWGVLLSLPWVTLYFRGQLLLLQCLFSSASGHSDVQIQAGALKCVSNWMLKAYAELERFIMKLPLSLIENTFADIWLTVLYLFNFSVTVFHHSHFSCQVRREHGVYA